MLKSINSTEIAKWIKLKSLTVQNLLVSNVLVVFKFTAKIVFLLCLFMLIVTCNKCFNMNSKKISPPHLYTVQRENYDCN